MIIVFLGPPGSGKGTQAKKLSERIAVPQLSTGDMLRSAMQSGSTLGMKAKSFMDSGSLVPDQVVVGLIRERIQREDCRLGFILDGFPRTVPQAEELDSMLASVSLKINNVILFEISDQSLVERLAGRRTCTQCASMYHLAHRPPKTPEICDQCSGSLIQRADDSAAVVLNRLSVYHAQTEPVAQFYRKANRLSEIDANRPMSEVEKTLMEVIN